MSYFPVCCTWWLIEEAFQECEAGVASVAFVIFRYIVINEHLAIPFVVVLFLLDLFFLFVYVFIFVFVTQLIEDYVKLRSRHIKTFHGNCHLHTVIFSSSS